MIAYLDTNVYIGTGYKFSSEKFSTLRSLIASGDVNIIYSSATQGEVEQHINDDIKAAVTKYNRVLRKELSSLMCIENFDLNKIDEVHAVAAVKDTFADFLSLDGVTKIDLNPLDAELLMQAYFALEAPFETKKPHEFKDAIMINAVKQYQKKVLEQIVIVSDDLGFRKAFEGDDNFITVQYLGDLIKMCNQKKAEYESIEACIINAVENNDFYDCMHEHFSNFDIDRGYYSEWECNDNQIDLIESELAYVEFADGKYLAHIDVVLWVVAEITHRDENTSYFDKEEQRYLIENYVTWSETHRIETNVIIECTVGKIDDEYAILDSIIINDRKFRTLDLDEYTMQSWNELETKRHEEPDLIYCSECGKVMGYSTEYTDYNDNPLCGNCMVTNEKGAICPTCGRKIPHELMSSGFCIDCLREQD